MGIDDALRAGQNRHRENASKEELEAAEREAARERYHAKEAATANDIAAAARRALQLLVERGTPEEVQVWARPRIGPNRGMVYGWCIPDLEARYSREILLDTGQIAQITPHLSRRDAKDTMTAEAWAAAHVKAARSAPNFETPGTLYREAFDRPWSNERAVPAMEARLDSVRTGVMNVLGKMLTDAGVEL
jgi:hypothetical protein